VTVLLPLCIGSLSACDIPTEVPEWDTRWVIPAESTSFAVADLLPPDISVAAAGDAFDLQLASISFSESLREMCGACVPLDGLTVPKPPFTVSSGGELTLPNELRSAQLLGGRLDVRLQHDLSFDPLRPSATARGYLILTARSGSAVLARDSLGGGTTPLPPGAVVTRILQLQPGAISGPIEVGLTLHSPAGDPALIDMDDRLTVEVAAMQVQVADARIVVTDQVISTPAIQLELDEIDEAVSGRVRGGAVHLEIDNPFEIEGTLELRINSSAAQIVKPVEIAPGSSRSRIDLTGAEMKSILGQSDVQLSISGLASSPSEGTAVEPTDAIGLGVRLELVISTREG
jgi:hypothetical protein